MVWSHIELYEVRDKIGQRGSKLKKLPSNGKMRPFILSRFKPIVLYSLCTNHQCMIDKQLN